MDDLGADLDGPKRLQNVDENGEGPGLEGAPREPYRTAGLVRTGGLTAAMSVPDLTRMNVGDERTLDVKHCVDGRIEASDVSVRIFALVGTSASTEMLKECDSPRELRERASRAS